MLNTTTKIGGRKFVQVEVLQAIKSRLDNLPTKQKTMLEFKDAAVFLYSGIKGAVQKNYTKDEIMQIITKEGWSITQNSFRYLWSLFLSEDGNPRKRKPYVRSAGKIKREKSNLAIEKIGNNIIEKVNAAVNKTPLSSDDLTSVPDTQTDTNNSARFELTPDTEDL